VWEQFFERVHRRISRSGFLSTGDGKDIPQMLADMLKDFPAAFEYMAAGSHHRSDIELEKLSKDTRGWLVMLTDDQVQRAYRKVQNGEVAPLGGGVTSTAAAANAALGRVGSGIGNKNLNPAIPPQTLYTDLQAPRKLTTAEEVALRVGAKQGVKITAAGLAAALTHGLSKEAGEIVLHVLQTETGQAVVSLLGGILTSNAAPLLPRPDLVNRIAREMRVEGMAVLGDELIDIVMEPLRNMLSGVIAIVPETIAITPEAPSALESPESFPSIFSEQKVEAAG
jgi:hypothetical protein